MGWMLRLKQIIDEAEVSYLKCDNCKVEISSLTNNCPLCGKYIKEGQRDNYWAYPDIKESANKYYSRKFKILIFFTIVFIIIMLTINILTPYKYFWSIIPVSAVFVIWQVVGVPIYKKTITPFMIFIDNAIISIFLIIIDLTIGNKGWAISYAVPFILFGSALIVTIIVIYIKMTWKEFYYFQLSIAAICFIPIIARAFFKFVFWPSLLSAAYGLITIIGMIIFGDKRFKHELKKRFHF
jgi:predicted nucleic acid-binding Zn ribbon protein